MFDKRFYAILGSSSNVFLLVTRRARGYFKENMSVERLRRLERKDFRHDINSKHDAQPAIAQQQRRLRFAEQLMLPPR